jgi:hypothetical protein
MQLKLVPFVASVAAVAILGVPGAHAQEVSPDFAGQVQITLPSNEQLVGEITDSLLTDDQAVISDQTNLSVSTGQNLVQQLTSALSIAPDDVSRSRVEGVRTHVQAAADSLQMAQDETNLDAARGRLAQARGEAQEALDELQPFVLGLVATGAITGK